MTKVMIIYSLLKVFIETNCNSFVNFLIQIENKMFMLYNTTALNIYPF